MLVDVEIKRMYTVLAHLFKDIIQMDGFLCGGFARYCCSPSKMPIESQDVDIYCPNDEAFERVKSRMVTYGYDVQYSSEVAETYRYSCSGKMPLQLIKPKIQGAIVARGSIEDILGAFDFTIARCGIFMKKISNDTVLDSQLEAVADEDFNEDETHRRLVIKNIHCPIAQVYRIAKYAEKGYSISVKEVLKVLEDWETRPETYKRQLIEALVKENPSQFDIQELEKMLYWD